MNIVKEYSNEKTKIRIHDDYIDKNEQKNIKEMVISLVLNQLKNSNTLL